ncbi:MAG: hypothetical protein ACXW1Q_07575, partial [Halobacteriota archaeon]
MDEVREIVARERAFGAGEDGQRCISRVPIDVDIFLLPGLFLVINPALEVGGKPWSHMVQVGKREVCCPLSFLREVLGVVPEQQGFASGQIGQPIDDRALLAQHIQRRTHLAKHIGDFVRIEAIQLKGFYPNPDVPPQPPKPASCIDIVLL